MKRLISAIMLALLGGLLWVALANTKSVSPSQHNHISPSRANAQPRLLWSFLAQTNQTAVTHSVSLSGFQVSHIADNRIVVTMRAEGDLPGSLTLVLDREGAGGNIVSGEWALVVSYIQDVAAGQIHAENEDGEHGGEILVRKGTLKGTISGGTVTLNADGTVTSVDSVWLNINGGSLAYDGVTGGNGIVNGIDLQDFSTSSGTLSLNF